MKLEEFKKYKKIVESRSPESIQNFPEAERIHQWMEETGRIDEGFFGSIWSWLKKNFSITGVRLHKLVNEYEKELYAETKAEWSKITDKSDLASRFRAGTYAKLSRDIESRMEILAGDDEDYRELVRTLINKKNLLVKKSLISAFTGVLDPEDVKDITRKNDDDLKKADREEDAAWEKAFAKDKDILVPKIEFLQKKISSNPRMFAEIHVASSVERQDFAKVIVAYAHKLSEVNKSFSFDEKNVYDITKKYISLVKEISKRLEGGDTSYDDVIDIVRSVLDRQLKSSKPEMIDKLKEIIWKEADKKIKDKSSGKEETDDTDTDIEDEVTTDYTDDIIDDEEVKTGVDDATEETGEKDSETDTVVKEIESFVSSYFEDNLTRFTSSLNSKIDDFNNKDDKERKLIMGKFDYDLDTDNKLKKTTSPEVKVLMKNFIEIAGAIVPYYQKKEEAPEVATKTALRFMFEIYAVKKDPAGKLKQNDIDSIVDNIKTQYSEDYK